jgi:dolichyl-phosphate-mannose--protein O-mannosyl transferase/Gpi18-like mannosyltransferase
VNARTNVRTSVRERMLPYGLPLLLLAGFGLRMAFVGAAGFDVDVRTFEAWTISLVDNGLPNFYAKTGFADYPPGYFYILAFFGHIWAFFRGADPHLNLLRVMVKLPAILADLGVGALLYQIGRWMGKPLAGLGAAALYLLSPATIFISAYWGQVDSVAGGLALLAAYMLLRSSDEPAGRFSRLIPAAWVVLAYSLLIKPQAAVLIAFFLAFAFTNRARMRERLAATAAGIGAALIFAVLLVIPFHPTANPVEALRWLLARYEFGSSVYDYNTVNAFNLWAIRGVFWQKDSTVIGYFVQLPQYVWGIVLVVSAVALLVWRYVQERTRESFLEASAIALLAFFILATRMHERYSFDAVLFCTACIPIARRYLWAALALSVVLFANLIYSLQYLSVVTNHTPGVNAQNLWGPLTTFYAVIAVGVFFGLGYVFLGSLPDPKRASEPLVPATPGVSGSGMPPLPKARRFFDPLEGLSIMRTIDYVMMGVMGVGSFILSFVRYWYPPDKIFDEIYFARAAEEYLRNMRIYENTHPPLSKLLVTLSVMLFGGLAHGDNSYGWRFLDVVFGALVVMLLYAFAKRITGSTLFASIASFFLICDGMHFVQSRIATPEGFVVVFSLAAVYAFYRFWIASQVEERAHSIAPAWSFAAAAAVSLVAGVLVVAVWDAIWSHMRIPGKLDTASSVIVALYVALGCYLLARYVFFRSWFADGLTESTFPDGAYALTGANTRLVHAPDGGSIDASGGKPKIVAGEISQNRGGALVYAAGGATITYTATPEERYDTPAGSAVFIENEIRAGSARERGSSANLWLVLFTIALGLLVSSKWYGVMGFGVSFCVLIAVWLQRVFATGRPLLWGNPRGFRLDGALATIVFIAATVYGLVWVPDLVRQSPDPGEIHNFNDVVYRQYTMFEYHDHLKATHPYSSKWFEWPIDYVPVAYFYQDHRNDIKNPNGCCVQEITSMPNPIGLWFGLFSVPFVGVLAWLRKHKGYALIVLTYLLQWLPWSESPRITFAYHFYVDIPLICLCNAIALQQFWERFKDDSRVRNWAIGGIAGAVAVVALAFVFFYPVLAAVPLTWNQWHARMWIPTWIIGPG